MSKRRSISNEIRLSQSFARLSLRQRDLWHGLIATADDQGRLPGHPAAIRSLVWPYDDILLSEVQKDIEAIEEQGNILIYKSGNDMFIQIIKWWQYQNMQWAGVSKYPAPNGWLDRVRITGKGKKIITENWHTPGGFFLETNDNVKVKVNVNVNPASKGTNKGTDKPTDKGAEFPFTDIDSGEDNGLYRELLTAFHNHSKMPIIDNLRPRDNEALNNWVDNECNEDDIKDAVQYATENDLPIIGPASINTGVMIAHSKRLRSSTKKSTLERLEAAGYTDD